MLSDSMMTWLTPTISGGRAAGSMTRQIIWRGVRAGHAAELDDLARHAASASMRDPHHRRHGIDDGGDQRRDRAEAEQEQDRQQIGEDRHGLHQVEDRRDDAARRSGTR